MLNGAGPRQLFMGTREKLLSRLRTETEAVQARQRQVAADQALTAAQQHIHQLSSGSCTSGSTSVTGVIDTRTLGKRRSLRGTSLEADDLAVYFQGCCVGRSPRMKDAFDLATMKGPDPITNNDMTQSLQTLSTQLFYTLVMMLNEQAVEIA